MARDLHTQLIDPTQQRARANFTLSFGRPLLVDGIQKLADQWLKIFLTPKGTHPWRPTLGTAFSYLLSNNATDLDTVQTAVLEYVEDATAQLKSFQQYRQGLPASEVLLSAAIIQFTRIDASSFDIWVRLVNAERSTLSVLIPYARIS